MCSSLPPPPDAEDPDLDALLADLCQLEEDTKAQLVTTNNLMGVDEGGAGVTRQGMR